MEHDFRCTGQTELAEIDGGEVITISCSFCGYFSYLDNSVSERRDSNPDHECNDSNSIVHSKSKCEWNEIYHGERYDQDTTDGDYKSTKGDFVDDILYVPSDPPSDKMHGKKNTINERFDNMIGQNNWKKCTIRDDSFEDPFDEICEFPDDRIDEQDDHDTRNDKICIEVKTTISEQLDGTVRAKDPSDSKEYDNPSHEDIDSVISSMKDLLIDIPCPYCQSTKTSEIKTHDKGVLDDHHIQYCMDCKSCFGADDSMDVDDLRKLLEEGEVIFKSRTKCSCGNDDVNKFIFTGFNESSGQPTIECQLCGETSDLAIIKDDHDNDDEDYCTNYDYGLNGDNKAQSYDDADGWESQSSDFVPEAFLCDSCNNKNGDLFGKLVNGEGIVTSVICWACEHIQKVDARFDREDACPRCSHKGLLSYDDRFRPKNANCPKCKYFVDFSKDDFCLKDGWSSRKPEDDEQVASWKTIPPARRRVRSLDEVMVGDHVAWQKAYLVWHHGIVVGSDLNTMKLTVVHYMGGLKKRDGHFASVRQDEIEVNPDKESFYVYDYGGNCYSPAEVVYRAQSRVGEHRYNPLSRNCEHFTSWCKTGLEKSNQVKEFSRRLLKIGGSMLSKGVQDTIGLGLRGLVEGTPMKQVFKSGFQDGLESLSGIAGVVELGQAAKGGVVMFDIFLNLALEIGMFAYGTKQAHKKYKLGQISKEDFRLQVCQLGCESAGGFLGSLGGGILGQLAIPVPFLGSMIGCTLGSLIGRFLGSMIGKKLGETLFVRKSEPGERIFQA